MFLSIGKTLSELESCQELLDNKSLIKGLTESWLNNYTGRIRGMNGYNSFEKHGTGTCGGVAFFIWEDLTFSKRRNRLAHYDEDFESVYIFTWQGSIAFQQRYHLRSNL